jgi:phosphate transport system substrate-binding protein
MRLLPFLCLLARLGSAQEMPAYQPRPVPPGVIRVLGNSHMDKLVETWEEGFRAHQPGVRFENTYLGTANAVAGLYLKTADLALMGREVMPMEDIAYRRVFPNSPLQLAVATASFDVPLETFAFAIFVNRRNPISQLTLSQADAIFGVDRKRGAPAAIATWRDLGLTGKWEMQSIHLHGYEIGSGLDYFFEQRVLGGGHKWNPGFHEYANAYGEGRKLLANAGDLIVKAIAGDEAAIGFCGFGHATDQVKALALSEDGGRYVPLTRENVLNRSYPLTRTVYIDVNSAPANPQVREFLRYVLSAEGQKGVRRQSVYLPLPAGFTRAELARLETATAPERQGQ